MFAKHLLYFHSRLFRKVSAASQDQGGKSERGCEAEREGLQTGELWHGASFTSKSQRHCPWAVWPCRSLPALLTFSLLLCEQSWWCILGRQGYNHAQKALCSASSGSVLSQQQLFCSRQPSALVTSEAVRPHRSAPRSWLEQAGVERIKPLVFVFHDAGPYAAVVFPHFPN